MPPLPEPSIRIAAHARPSRAQRHGGATGRTTLPPAIGPLRLRGRRQSAREDATTRFGRQRVYSGITYSAGTRKAMENPALSAMVAALARQAADGAEASTLAASIASTWRQIEQALTPILGARGVAALFKRALFLTKDRFPWLEDAFAATEASSEHGALDVFGVVLSRQSAATAAAGAGAFLTTFHDVLVSMIGATLTERLLQSVWATFSSGSPAQDISS